MGRLRKVKDDILKLQQSDYFIADPANIKLKEHNEILEILRKAYTQAGVTIVENKVRGGTDGSNLSNEGLPTPNIFTGALNCHGPYECLPVNSFNKAYKVTEKIVEQIKNRD